MQLLNSFMVFISGGLVVASIMMTMIGYKRSVLSRKNAAFYSGIGVGIGVGIFIYYGVSSGNLLESILTGVTVACVTGLSLYSRYK